MGTTLRTCPLCEAVCGLRITLDDEGRVSAVHGDEHDPFSRGFLCPKGASLGRLDEDPDRLRGPLVRDRGRWRPVDWDRAFALVDDGLSGVIDRHGRQALALYLGNPTFHTMAGILYRGPLAAALGTRNVFSASTVDQMPKHVACGLMLGDPWAVGVPDLDRTDHLLILGANPAVSNGSLCAAPDFPGRLKALRGRGGRVVVVDPRRTRTSELADEHVFVRPGTDPLLLFGIVHTLLAEGLDRVTLPVDGLAELRELARGFAPATVAPVCGVPVEVIVRLARELAAAPTAAVYGRIGTCTVEFGTLAQWLIDVINVLTGNLDRPGGVMFSRCATAEVHRSPEPYVPGRWHSRVRGLPETLGELPAATLVDEIEQPGEGQVRALVTVAGNPVLSTPDGARLDRALPGLDFMVCVDPYLNETTRHAHVVLPPPRMLQMPHYDFLISTITVRNYARFSPPSLPLGPDQRSEAEIMSRLVMIASGHGADADPEGLTEQMLAGMLQAATATPGSPVAGVEPDAIRAGLTGDSGPERLLDAMLRIGPYGLSLERLREHPHGLDLGPLEPRLAELLTTPTGRVQLAPAPLVADVDRLRAALARPRPDLVLIGRRHLRSNNSWMHNVPRLTGGSNRCTLQIHPDDVRRLGLGDRARITSAVGELVVELEPTTTIMPGVVSLPHGWGHGATGQRVARADAGANANALTDGGVLDELSGNAVFNGVPVRLARPEESAAQLSKLEEEQASLRR
ncbi:molybdopterin oxidoreductase family protein [Micromonospora sp. NPDC050980]|uniref:molybdopterin oxidoreductase family protein n=1 Tax=Micromonospora sp. NPDC050980 TaxID=3155161 RepID=UPI0033FFE43B